MADQTIPSIKNLRGNIGIGTASPSYKLEVDGGDFLVNTANGGYVQVDESDNSLKLSDNIKLKVGTGNDLKIYHDGSNSYITEGGTGNLLIQGADVEIQTVAGNKYFTGSSNVAKLYHTNNEKLATTSTGVSVTGRLTASEVAVTNIVTNKVVKFNGTLLDDSIITDDGSTVTVGGDLTVSGGLTINGTTTTINSTTLQIDDKNIELGTVATPSDTTADGGGITLKGASDYTIRWADGTNSWHFNQGITVGANGTGHDVVFYGDTSDRYMTWDQSADKLHLRDSVQLTLGTHNDLQLSHDGVHGNVLYGGPNNLQISGNTVILIGYNDGSTYGETAMTMTKNGAVTIRHDNSTKFTTDAGGVTVTGKMTSDTITTAGNLELFQSGNNNYISSVNTGSHLLIRNTGGANVELLVNTSEKGVIAKPNNAVELYYDNAKKFETSSTGATITGNLVMGGGQVKFANGGHVMLGDSNDLRLYHNGNSYIAHDTEGDFFIQQNLADKDLVLQCDDGSGGTTDYFRLDGSDAIMKAHRKIRFLDNVKATFGNSDDLDIYHASSDNNNYIQANNGRNLFIESNGISIRSETGENMITATGNGAVKLYYDNASSLETVNNGVKINFRHLIRNSNVSFTNGVANQKVDLYWTGTQQFWGEIIVTVTSTYNNQNASGSITKKFYVGLNANNTIFTNECRYTDAGGVTADNFAISDLRWDSTNSRYYITIVHRVSTGNEIGIKVEAYSKSYTYINNIDDITTGSVYTTDTTTYAKPYVYYKDRVGIRSDLDCSSDFNTHTKYALNLHNLANDTNESIGVSFGLSSDATAVGAAIAHERKGSSSYGDLYFLTRSNGGNVTERMRIDASGNVGIGTTSPLNRFNVVGSSDLQTAVTKITRTHASASNNTYTFEVDSSSHTSNMTSGGAMAVDVNSGRAFTINGNGNVGIGTTSPATKLVIDNGGVGTVDNGYSLAILGDGIDGVQIISSSSHQGRIVFGDNSSNAIGRLNYDHSNDSMSFVTNGSEAMRIDSSGNVGIGTTSPNYLLDVEKAGAGMRVYNTDTNGQTDLHIRTAGTTGSSRIFFGDTDDSDIGSIIYRHNGNSLAFETNDAEAVRINSAGNVGIGTTSPTARLQVENSAGGNLLTLARNSTSKLDFEFGTSNVSLVCGGEIQFRANGGTTNKFIINNSQIQSNAKFLVNTSSGIDVHTGDSGNILLSGNSSATGTPDQFFLKHNLGGVELGNSRGRTTVTTGDFQINTQFRLTSSGSGLTVIRHNGTNNYYENYNGHTYFTNHDADKHIHFQTDDGSGGVAEYFRMDGVDLKNVFSKGLRVPDGSASAPAIAGTNDTDTGIYWDSANQALRFSTAGVQRGSFSSAGVFSTANVYSGTTGQFRNYGGTWKATTGTTGNGFQFISADATAMVLSSTGSLDVTNNLTANSFIQDGNTGNNFYAVRFGRSNLSESNPDMYGEGDTLILGADSDQPTLVIRDTEYVGIGTASPAERLEVAGNIAVRNGTYPTQIELYETFTDGSNYERAQLKFANGYFTINPQETGTGTQSGIDLAIGGTSKLKIEPEGHVLINGANDNSDMADFAVNTGGNPQISWRGNQVQIGSTDQNWSGRIYTDGQFRMASYATDMDFFIAWSSGNVTKDIKFRPFNGTASSEAMRIKGDGKVGIGTTSPSEKLHVDQGFIRVQSPDVGGVTPPFVTIGQTSNAYQAGIKSSLHCTMTSGTAYGELIFTTNTAIRMVIKPNGNVGVGTVSPSERLHVVGPKVRLDTDAGGYYGHNASGDFRYALYDNNSVTRLYGDGNGNAASLEIDSNKVGLGCSATANSKASVFIKGEDTTPTLNGTAVDDATLILTNSYTTDPYGLCFGVNTSGTSLVQSRRLGSETYFKLALNPYGGNVGIGTDDPDAELHVEGIIKQKVFTATTLPSAGSSMQGARAFISDSSSPYTSAYVGSTVGSGGGSNFVPVYCDGSSWYIG